MGQEETLKVLMESPFIKFSARAIMYELKSNGIIQNLQSVYSNLRALLKGKLIKYEKGNYWYEDDSIDGIIKQSEDMCLTWRIK